MWNNITSTHRSRQTCLAQWNTVWKWGGQITTAETAQHQIAACLFVRAWHWCLNLVKPEFTLTGKTSHEAARVWFGLRIEVIGVNAVININVVGLGSAWTETDILLLSCPSRVKAYRADMHFHYLSVPSCAEPHPGWIISRVGPKHVGSVSKRVAMTSCQPQPTCSQTPPSPPPTSVYCKTQLCLCRGPERKAVLRLWVFGPQYLCNF